MRLTSKKRLSFRRIADEWAREVAAEPGALDADAIHQRLVAAIVLGDFEDEAGEHPSLELPRRRGEPPLLVTRRMLAAAMPPVYGLQMPPKSDLRHRDEDEGGSIPWDDLKPRIPFDAWSRVPRAAYERYYLKAWLEDVTIGKADFHSWCLKTKWPLPRFWFTDDEIAAVQSSQDTEARVQKEHTHIGRRPRIDSGETRGRKKGSGTIDDKKPLDAMSDLLTAGKAKSVNDAARQVAKGMTGQGFEANRRRLHRKFKALDTNSKLDLISN